MDSLGGVCVLGEEEGKMKECLVNGENKESFGEEPRGS